VNLNFNDHANTWKVFHALHRASTKEGLCFLHPSWIRTQKYYKIGTKAKLAVEQALNVREMQSTIDVLNSEDQQQPTTVDESLLPQQIATSMDDVSKQQHLF
jgi:hypothetical protein